MATTPRALIQRALRKSGVLGVGQTASTDDVQDAFDDLTDMLAQWNTRRWLVPNLTDVSFGPSGKASYTIGPGGDIDTIRPDRLEAAFVRINQFGTNPVDYPIDVLDSREDWNAVTLKSWASIPYAVWLDTDYPLSRVYLWPNQGATGAAEVHLTVKSALLAAVLTLDTPISLPPSYTDALLYGLATRLRPSYQLPPDVSLVALARSALASIRNTNAQIPRARMPDGLPGVRAGYMGSLLAGSSGGLSPKPFQLDGISELDGPDTLL